MYYKEAGRHNFVHTRFARAYWTDSELQADPTYQQRHWLLTVNGVGERAMSVGYKNDDIVLRLITQNVPGVTKVVFLYECKPLTVKESFDIWQAGTQLAKAEK